MKRGDVITVSITDYAFGGKGIAKVETENGEYVIFVENTFGVEMSFFRICSILLVKV